MFVVELREAGGKFAGVGAGGGDDDEGFAGFNVGLGAVTFVATDGVDVGGVAFCEGVAVGSDAAAFEAVFEFEGVGLVVVSCDDDGCGGEFEGGEMFDEAQKFGFVADAVVSADFLLFDVEGADAEDDFEFVFELDEGFDFAAGVEAGEDARGVEVVEDFAAEFEVELVAEIADYFVDAGGLELDVAVVIEAVHVALPCSFGLKKDAEGRREFVGEASVTFATKKCAVLVLRIDYLRSL